MSEREPIHEPALPYIDEEVEAIHAAADRFEHATAPELLEWALDRFHPRMAISAAGGVDGMALIDMAWRINPEIRVFTLDTGRLPPETYTLFEEIREHYGIAVEFEYPDREAVTQLVSTEGPNLMYRSVDLRVACCEIRKVEPLKRKLATLDAWVAGLRREQWKTRKNIAKVEVDRDHGGIVKLNPMADWKLDEVWDYVRKNEVPYHELFDHGYTSIGCAPCTRPILPGQSERAGRWWWEEETDKECGLHCSVGLLGSKSDSERAGESASDDRGGVVAMPFGYPVFLELAGRHAVVIGETAVREGKVEGLLAADVGSVTVIAERPAARLESLAALDPRVTVERRTWRPADLDGAFVCVASSDDPAERAAVAREARDRGVLVNVMDDIPNCDWAAPSIVRRGELVLAISTGGASPALAKKLRLQLSAAFGEEWAEVLAVLRDVRAATTAVPPRYRRARVEVGLRAGHRGGGDAGPPRPGRRAAGTAGPPAAGGRPDHRADGHRLPGGRRPGRPRGSSRSAAPRCSGAPTSSSTTAWRLRRCSIWRRPSAERIYAGKEPGRPAMPQAEIDALLGRTRARRSDRGAAEGRRPVRVRPRRRGAARVHRGRRGL